MPHRGYLVVELGYKIWTCPIGAIQKAIRN
jgi:hypothetical protein